MLRATVFFLMVFSTIGAWADWSTWIERYGAAVAKVDIRLGGVLQGSGSAFAIDEGHLLTSAHVVTSAQFDKKVEIQLTFPLSAEPKKVVSARIEVISDELDLAVLAVDMKFAAPFPLSAEPHPRLMSEVLALGFPLGLNFKATPGFLQAYQDVPQLGTMLDLSASIDPGNSGGPVLGSDGKVIGIVTSKIVGYNFNLALPIQNAVDFLALSRHPLTFQVSSVPTGARVFANGQFKGTAPLTLSLMSRRVELSVEKEGYEVSTRTVTAEADKVDDQEFKLSASASLSAHVTLRVDPPQSRVWLNNSELKPPFELNVDKGTRLRLRVEAPGYETLTTVVELTNENEQPIQLTLKKARLLF